MAGRSHQDEVAAFRARLVGKDHLLVAGIKAAFRAPVFLLDMPDGDAIEVVAKGHFDHLLAVAQELQAKSSTKEVPQ